jgi:hypothetical protein
MKSASIPNAHRRARERRHVLALAARSIAGAARQLHRVGGVETRPGKPKLAHDRQACA